MSRSWRGGLLPIGLVRAVAAEVGLSPDRNPHHVFSEFPDAAEIALVRRGFAPRSAHAAARYSRVLFSKEAKAVRVADSRAARRREHQLLVAGREDDIAPRKGSEGWKTW